MAERWVSTKAGAHLAGRRKVNTAPEVLLRQAVHAAGGRFRLHRQIAKGCTPDFVLPSRRIAVFVDGCFWHGCPEHGRKTPWTGPNAACGPTRCAGTPSATGGPRNWHEEHGWHVVRVWECQVRRDPSAVAQRS